MRSHWYKESGDESPQSKGRHRLFRSLADCRGFVIFLKLPDGFQKFGIRGVPQSAAVNVGAQFADAGQLRDNQEVRAAYFGR